MKSFERVKHWVTELRRMASPSIKLVICGNKCDMERSRKVDKDAAAAYAKEVGASHFLTSAKMGDGVKEAFGDLTKSERSDSLAAVACAHAALPAARPEPAAWREGDAARHHTLCPASQGSPTPKGPVGGRARPFQPGGEAGRGAARPVGPGEALRALALAGRAGLWWSTTTPRRTSSQRAADAADPAESVCACVTHPLGRQQSVLKASDGGVPGTFWPIDHVQTDLRVDLTPGE